jgi:hypothetical protein
VILQGDCIEREYLAVINKRGEVSGGLLFEIQDEHRARTRLDAATTFRPEECPFTVRRVRVVITQDAPLFGEAS